MSLCTYETRNISLADMLVRALPLVSPTSETLIAARLGSCPEEWASRFVVGSLERPGPGAPDLEGCHISRRAAAAAWPVHESGSRRRDEASGERTEKSFNPGEHRQFLLLNSQHPDLYHPRTSDTRLSTFHHSKPGGQMMQMMQMSLAP